MEKLNAKEVLQFVAAMTGMMAELHKEISTAELRKCITNRPFLKQRLLEVFRGVSKKSSVQEETPEKKEESLFSKLSLARDIYLPQTIENFDFDAEKQAIKIDFTKSWADWTAQEQCFPAANALKVGPWAKHNEICGYDLRKHTPGNWGAWFRRFFKNENLEKDEILLEIRRRHLFFDLSQICFFLKEFIWEDNDQLQLDCKDSGREGNTFIVLNKGTLGICTVRYRVERKQPHFVISEFEAFESEMYRYQPDPRRLYFRNNPEKSTDGN